MAVRVTEEEVTVQEVEASVKVVEGRDLEIMAVDQAARSTQCSLHNS